MALPLGYFDETAYPAGWWSEYATPAGWFGGMLSTSDVPDEPPPPEPEPGGSGTPQLSELPSDPAPAPTPEPIILKPIQGKKLYVYDEGGYLPDNPDEWPEELKRDIRRCCCGGASSPGPQPTRNNPCCPGLKLPDTLRGNIKNTRTHDTGLTLRYYPQVTISQFGIDHPEWIPFEAFPVPTINNAGIPSFPVIYPEGWYSDLIYDFTCSYSFSGRYWQNAGGFGAFIPIDWIAEFEVDVYYYVVYGWSSIGLPVTSGCYGQLMQVAFPRGTLTRTGGFGVPAVRPITWLDNNGLPGEINAFNSEFFTYTRTAVTGGLYYFGQNSIYNNCYITKCNPFELKAGFARTPFNNTNVASSVITRCHRLKITPVWIPPGTPQGTYPVFSYDEAPDAETISLCTPSNGDPSNTQHIEIFL